MTATEIAISDESPRKSLRRNSAPATRKAPVRSRAKASLSGKPKAVPSAAPAAKETAMPVAPQVWTAQFVYACADGSNRISLLTINADSADAARAIAVAHAPAKEFMVSILPRSEEQFLGQVRFKALAVAGKTG